MWREERGLEGSTASDDSIEKGVFFWGGVRGCFETIRFVTRQLALSQNK
jgi:hypothetical protein